MVQNTNLKTLFCQSNLLIADQLNIQNGNNENLLIFNATNNPTKQAAFSQYDRPKARARYAEIAEHLGYREGNTETKVNALLGWLEELKIALDIPMSIQAAGVNEAEFMAKVDSIAEDAFDDQCTGANPRYPLIKELKEVLIASYYGTAYADVIDAPEVKAEAKAKKAKK